MEEERRQDTAPEQESETTQDEATNASGPTTADIADAGPTETPEPSETQDAGAEQHQPAERVEEQTPLLDEEAADEFRERWQKTQADFVDDPRSAVTTADALVAELMKRLAEEFARERSELEKQWSAGGEASTEDLRVALQRYRSFFSRLLSL